MWYSSYVTVWLANIHLCYENEGVVCTQPFFMPGTNTWSWTLKYSWCQTAAIRQSRLQELRRHPVVVVQTLGERPTSRRKGH